MQITKQNILTNGATKVSLLDLPPEAWTKTGGVADSEVMQLYSEVAWLYAVQQTRAEAISGLPLEVHNQAGDPVEALDLPFDLDLERLLYQTSLALDLYGAAYWFKVRQVQRLDDVMWLQPSTMHPEVSEAMGLVGFKRTLGAKWKMYPVKDGMSDDLGWVWLPGLKEMGPGTPPASVVKDAAEVLKNLTKTAAQFFERGAIDHWLVTAETMPSETEKKRIRGWLTRMLRGGVEKAGKVEVLSSALKLQKLNSSVKEWVLGELTGLKADDICNAYKVPREIMQPRLSTNKSTHDRVTQNWINDSIAPQAQRIARALNKHVLKDQGYELVFNAQALNVNQEDERNRSIAYAQLYAANMPPETIVEVLGMHVPDGMELERDDPRPMDAPPKVPDERAFEEQEEQEPDDRKAQERRRLKAFVRKGNHLERPFKSDILTQAEIEVVTGPDAPFRDWQGYP